MLLSLHKLLFIYSWIFDSWLLAFLVKISLISKKFRYMFFFWNLRVKILLIIKFKSFIFSLFLFKTIIGSRISLNFRNFWLVLVCLKHAIFFYLAVLIFRIFFFFEIDSKRLFNILMNNRNICACFKVFAFRIFSKIIIIWSDLVCFVKLWLLIFCFLLYLLIDAILIYNFIDLRNLNILFILNIYLFLLFRILLLIERLSSRNILYCAIFQLFLVLNLLLIFIILILCTFTLTLRFGEMTLHFINL